MLTRRDIMNIKPGSEAEVRRILKAEVIPLLRRQKGRWRVIASKTARLGDE